MIDIIEHMKRAVIFLNGDKPNKNRVNRILKKTDTIICADGGAKHVSAFGLQPDLIIGDQDSLPTTLIKKFQKTRVEFIKHPVDKDQTDSELAIDYALTHGFSEIVVFGMLGDRIDHVLGSLFFLTFHSEHMTVRVITNTQDIYVLKNSEVVLKGKKGDYISLLPMTDAKNNVTTQGLAYQLYNDTLPFGKTLGISNQFSKNKATITVSKGTLLVIHTIFLLESSS